jgi:hypothetical protein
MNYVDTLLMIQETNEVVLSQEAKSMFTATRRFVRVDEDWVLDPEPGMPVEKYTKGGKIFVWSRSEEDTLAIRFPQPSIEIK